MNLVPNSIVKDYLKNESFRIQIQGPSFVNLYSSTRHSRRPWFVLKVNTLPEIRFRDIEIFVYQTPNVGRVVTLFFYYFSYRILIVVIGKTIIK